MTVSDGDRCPVDGVGTGIRSPGLDIDATSNWMNVPMSRPALLIDAAGTVNAAARSVRKIGGTAFCLDLYIDEFNPDQSRDPQNEIDLLLWQALSMPMAGTDASVMPASIQVLTITPDSR